jgi:small subunit ribosomal protein S6
MDKENFGERLMASNVYETLFILDSNRYARDPAGVSGTITTMIESLGGKILANRLYAEQKLAYPIKGHQKGTYWLTYFELPTGLIKDFYAQCKLNEGVVRQLTLRVDPRLVEPMVAHARGEVKLPRPDGVLEAEEDGQKVVGA